MRTLRRAYLLAQNDRLVTEIRDTPHSLYAKYHTIDTVCAINHRCRHDDEGADTTSKLKQGNLWPYVTKLVTTDFQSRGTYILHAWSVG